MSAAYRATLPRLALHLLQFHSSLCDVLKQPLGVLDEIRVCCNALAQTLARQLSAAYPQSKVQFAFLLLADCFCVAETAA